MIQNILIGRDRVFVAVFWGRRTMDGDGDRRTRIGWSNWLRISRNSSSGSSRMFALLLIAGPLDERQLWTRARSRYDEGNCELVVSASPFIVSIGWNNYGIRSETNLSGGNRLFALYVCGQTLTHPHLPMA